MDRRCYWFGGWLWVCLWCSQTFAQTLEIVPLGDSITEAEEPYNSYRRPLYWYLKSVDASVEFVGSQTGVLGSVVPPNNDFDADHEGHWGWTTQNMLYSAGGLASRLSAYRVDIVLLLLGANDLMQCRGVNAALQGVRDVIAVLRSINPEVVVLVGTLLPINGSYCQTTANTLVADFNAQLPELVAMLSTPLSPLLLVEQNQGFDLGTDSYDGIHPNLSGELKVAERWFRALIPVVLGPDIHQDGFE